MTDHDVILDWCRSDPRPLSPVMRLDVRGHACAVLDQASTEPVPGGFDWERRPRLLAAAASWEECLAQLRAAGLLP